MRVALQAPAIACVAALAFASATPAAAQLGGLLGGRPSAGSETIVGGQTLAGLTRTGLLTLTFAGQAGEQVTFRVETDSERDVVMSITPDSSGLTRLTTRALATSSGRFSTAVAVLPRDGNYLVTLADPALFPAAFNYSLSFTSSLGTAPGSRQQGEAPAGTGGRVLYFGDDAPAPATRAPARAPATGPASAARRVVAATAPAVAAPAVPMAGATTPVPAHCRRQACWGGMDQYIGYSFSRFEITIPETQRISFHWQTPGQVIRMDKSAYDTVLSQTFMLNPETGAPFGFTILDNGTLVSDTEGVEGAMRMVYRFIGDRFETNMDEYKGGRWRPWRQFGVFGANESYRSEQAIQQARQEQNEMFGMLGAVLGGAAAGMQSNGDMASITAGMAVGSSLAASDSEIATAASRNLRVEAQRLEEQRELERRTIAAMNDPNNPLTQQQRRESQAREARNTSERENLQREHRAAEVREAEDREALARANTYRNSAEAPAPTESDQGASDRLARERREAQQRARNEEQRLRQEAEQQEQERQLRAQAEREAESRRQDEERRRAAAEAGRNRVIDFKEAVVLCQLTGGQAQFGNWRCEGPLQMNYVNFENANWVAAMAMTDCSSPRELPRAGPYRAFGCGYGIHPTSPGALRNVPEMLGVFVDGRYTFRCQRNISGVCRSR